MLFKAQSAAVYGIDAYLVEVETDFANGLPTVVTVGLPQGAGPRLGPYGIPLLDAARPGPSIHRG